MYNIVGEQLAQAAGEFSGGTLKIAARSSSVKATLGFRWGHLEFLEFFWEAGTSVVVEKFRGATGLSWRGWYFEDCHRSEFGRKGCDSRCMPWRDSCCSDIEDGCCHSVAVLVLLHAAGCDRPAALSCSKVMESPAHWPKKHSRGDCIFFKATWWGRYHKKRSLWD